MYLVHTSENCYGTTSLHFNGKQGQRQQKRHKFLHFDGNFSLLQINLYTIRYLSLRYEIVSIHQSKLLLYTRVTLYQKLQNIFGTEFHGTKRDIFDLFMENV